MPSPCELAIVLQTASEAAVATDNRQFSRSSSRYCPHSLSSSSHAAAHIHWRPRSGLSSSSFSAFSLAASGAAGGDIGSGDSNADEVDEEGDSSGGTQSGSSSSSSSICVGRVEEVRRRLSCNGSRVTLFKLVGGGATAEVS